MKAIKALGAEQRGCAFSVHHTTSSYCLKQEYSKYSLNQNYLQGLLKHRLLDPPQSFDSTVQGKSLIICISDKFPGDAIPAGPYNQWPTTVCSIHLLFLHNLSWHSSLQLLVQTTQKMQKFTNYSPFQFIRTFSPIAMLFLLISVSIYFPAWQGEKKVKLFPIILTSKAGSRSHILYITCECTEERERIQNPWLCSANALYAISSGCIWKCV